MQAKNGHVNITMPLSLQGSFVVHMMGIAIYGQPVHQTRSLYVYSLQDIKVDEKMQNWGGLGV